MLLCVSMSQARERMFIDDTFTQLVRYEELQKRLNTRDTIVVIDPETEEETTTIVLNEFDWRSIKKFRIKEDCAFDNRHGHMIVRIIGIAPIREVYDERGNYRGEEALFWIYYPDFRNYLATYEAFSLFEEGLYYSWEDILELRYFDSHIVKESNVKDERIEDQYTGKQALTEAQHIQQKMFEYEQKLWEY